MALKLNQTTVSNNERFFPMLANLQANILKGHGRNFAHHLFFQFEKEKAGLAKSWIAEFANHKITSAKQQMEGRSRTHNGVVNGGGTVFTLSLTAAGYIALGLDEFKPAGVAFNRGMKARAASLGEDVKEYSKPFLAPIHMLIIVADDDIVIAKAEAENIARQLSSFGLLLLDQRGNFVKIDNRSEYLGEANGMSHPLYFSGDIDRELGIEMWDGSTNLDLLLVPDRVTNDPDSFGSYLVFKKLQQHVGGERDEECSPSTNQLKSSILKNDLGKRKIRRGMPYNDIVNSEGHQEADGLLDLDEAQKDSGLLFMCYQRSIDFQFEIMQMHWANEVRIRNYQLGIYERLLENGINLDKISPKKYGATVKGGEYFFTPSKAFLKSLHQNE